MLVEVLGSVELQCIVGSMDQRLLLQYVLTDDGIKLPDDSLPSL